MRLLLATGILYQPLSTNSPLQIWRMPFLQHDSAILLELWLSSVCVTHYRARTLLATDFTSFIGVQLFMCSYSFIVFLETPKTKRKGRWPYLVVMLVIFGLYAVWSLLDTAWLYLRFVGVDPSAPRKVHPWVFHGQTLSSMILIVVSDALLVRLLCLTVRLRLNL